MMATDELKLPDGFILFEYQVAGHGSTPSKSGKCDQIGFLMNTETKRVFKPLQTKIKKGETKTYGERERMFDSFVWDGVKNENVSSSDFKLLRKFIPLFYDVRSLEINGYDYQFLELENICANFKKPCLVDIKVGRKHRKLNAGAKTFDSNDLRYNMLYKLGFRVSGLLIFESNSDHFEKYDKQWAMNLITADDGFNKFFATFFKKDENLPKLLVESIIDKLKELRQFFENQRFVKFSRSSILIIYESAKIPSENLKTKIDFTNYVDVRIVDFTKYKLGEVGKDDDFLFGLKNLIIYLENYLINL